MPRVAVGSKPLPGGGSFAVELLATFVWNQWQASPGISGSFRVERMAGLPWNQWQLWRGIRTTTMEDRKMLLRYLVKRVHLDGVTETGKIRLDVEWHTGAHTSTTIARAMVGVWAPIGANP